MIVPDDAPSSPLKGQSSDVEHGQQPPPSYGAAVNQPGGSLPHLQIPPHPPSSQPYGVAGHSYRHVPPPSHYNPELDRQHRRNARRRFCKALFVGILVWILVTTLFGSMFGLKIRRHGNWRNDYKVDLPPDVSVDRCVGVEKYPDSSPGTAYTSFEFPVSSEGLLVMSRGSLSGGQLRVSTSGAGAESTDAKIDVSITFYRWDVLSRAQLCKIRRKNGEVGLAILTPKWVPDWGHESRLHFDVHLSFLGSPDSARALTVKKLETDLPNFSQDIDNTLKNNVYFQDVVLEGSNGYILAESIGAQNVRIKNANAPVTLMTIVADNIDVRTSNGVINGHYVANGTLKLETDNSPIKVDVDLTAPKQQAGELSLKTSNSPITADVNFHSTASYKNTGKDSKFTFNAESSNGGLHLNVKEMPLDSKLNMDSKTSNGIVNVWLPPTYEGSFDLRTSSSMTPSLRVEEKDDPWGKKRSRSVEKWTNGHKEMTGNVYWGDKKKAGQSSLMVETSNAPVTLTL